MSTKNRYVNLISQEKRLLEVLKSVRNQIEEIKKGFKKDFIEEEKILYTLEIIKKGSLKEIKEFISIFDSSYKSQNAIKLIEQVCENLLREEKIGLVKIGNEYGYYLLISCLKPI